MTNFKHTLRAAAAALALWGGAGCSPYAGFCADQMDCRSGNDADIEMCAINLKRDEDYAAVNDCSREWDDYFTCLTEKSHCSNNNWTDDASCANDWVDLQQCIN
jgi:hypothetical protein